MKEKADGYCEPISFTKFVNWVVGKVETFSTAAPPSVRELVQLLLLSSDPDLYQASSVSCSSHAKKGEALSRNQHGGVERDESGHEEKT